MTGAASRPLFAAVGNFGAGKTTLVRRLARQALAIGERPAIVVNELGASRIDEAALAAEGVPVVAASGGCACCDVREALLQAVARAASLDGVTGILVEAAGCADGARFTQALAEAARALGLDAPRVVSVIDAQQIETSRASPAPADAVLLNKVDTRFDDEVEPMRASVARRSSGAPVIATVESTVDLEELGGWRRSIVVASARTLAPALAHAPARVVEIELAEPISRAALTSLVADPPPGVARAKGFARMVGERGVFAIQIVGRSGVFRLCSLEPEPETRVVFFGASLDPAATRARVLESK